MKYAFLSLMLTVIFADAAHAQFSNTYSASQQDRHEQERYQTQLEQRRQAEEAARRESERRESIERKGYQRDVLSPFPSDPVLGRRY